MRCSNTLYWRGWVSRRKIDWRGMINMEQNRIKSKVVWGHAGRADTVNLVLLEVFTPTQ